MSEAMVFDAIRTPRGRGKANGSLHEVKPITLLTGVLKEGAVIGVLGIVAGAAGGVLLARVVGSFVSGVQMPGLVPIAAAAMVLVAAAILASVTPAARASRVDVVRALRSE